MFFCFLLRFLFFFLGLTVYLVEYDCELVDDAG